MVATVALLLVSAGVIYVSCEYFVNGVEWAGQRLGVSQSAVGTVLAAFGTALPESVVTFVAVVFGDSAAQKDIGVGAALGGPLVLGTIAYAVVGAVFLTQRKQAEALLEKVDSRKLSRDQAWFMGIFILKVALGLVVFAIKPWLGLLFVLAYAIYVWREIRREGTAGSELELEPLKFQPRAAEPSTGWAVFQTLAALVVIFMSSRVFVHQLDAIGPALGMSPQMVALLLSPVATELPEILNAVIWVRQGKIALALGNISGAMMIQATIPSALGIFFTPWMLSPPLVWGAVVTMIGVAVLFTLLRMKALTPLRLSLLSLLYLLFAVMLIFLPATAANAQRTPDNLVQWRENLASSAQPDAKWLQKARENGYEVVVNLAPPQSQGSLRDEGGIVAASGITYVNIPVDFSHPTLEDFRFFSEVLRANTKRNVLVHCQVNLRGSSFTFLYRVIHEGADIADARGKLTGVWTPDPVWRRFIDETLQANGKSADLL